MKTKFYILLTMLLTCVMQVKGEITLNTEVSTAGFGKADPHSGIGLCDYYENFSSQTLYTAQQVGHTGKITAIAYYAAGLSDNPVAVATTVHIYMAHFGHSSLNGHLVTDRSQMTEVFTGNINTFTTIGWKTIDLTTPFEYNGGNLLVVVECQRSGYSKVNYSCDSSSGMCFVKHYDGNATYANAFNGQNFSDVTYTPNTRFTITSESEVVRVGNGTANSNWIGFNSNYLNQAMQSLYLGSEIGESGYMSKLSFQLSSTASSDAPVNSVKVWLAEVEPSMTTLSSSNKLNTADMTLVFDGAVSEAGLSAGNWLSVTFDTPFYFNNNKNLVVAVSNSSTAKNTVMYRGTTMSDRTMTTITSSNPNSVIDKSSNLPNARFTFTDIHDYKGEDSKSNYAMGYNPTQNNTSSQCLYLNTEVGGSGYINRLGFKAAVACSETTTLDVMVYMAEVAQQTLTSSTKLSTNDMTLVYNGSITVGGNNAGDWFDISLNTPFCYTGVGNLVVAVSNHTTTTISCPIAVSSMSSRSAYSMSNNDPNQANSTSSNLPHVRFVFATHDCGTSYTTNGFGICKNCQKELLYEFKKPTDITGSSDYRISNVGELMWFSRAVNKGQAGTSYWGYLSNDIDLTGYNWIPIGNDTNPMKCRLYGYDRNTTVGHTISGIPSTSSLLGTFSGVLYSLRLTSGALVNKGSNGTIYSCLTLGSALVKSGTASINNSYYLSTSTADAARGARTTAQMKSGQVTYELSQSSNSKWYQTLGTDDYPMVSGTDKVYRYTQCPSTTMYTNNESWSGTVQGHNWLNTVCSKCGSEPTTLSGDIMLTDYDAYTRKKDASVDGTLSMFFGNLKTNLWRPLYIPFRSYYQGSNENRYYVAKIQDFGVAQDTNGDGVVDSRDERFLTAIFLEDGSYIEPNTPYLIWPMDRYLTLRSSDNRLYPATINELDLSTMKESFVIKGSYEKQPLSVDNLKYFESDDNMYFASTTDYSGPFSWVPEYTMKNGGMVRDHVGTFVHRLGLALNDGISFTSTDPFWCDKVSYTRKSEVITTHNWQGVLVPFEVTVKHNAGSEYPKYATFAGVKTNANGEEEFTLDILKEGDVIPAATPFLMCVDEEDTDLVLENSSVLLHYPSSDAITFDTENASYFISGTTVPTDNLGDEWYAISRYDGMFHPASAGAVLPRYRIYMKLQTKNGKSASELRFVFREAYDETAIDHVDAVMAPDAIYTLDGRKVQEESLQPGIYVKNGKKISIRK